MLDYRRLTAMLAYIHFPAIAFVQILVPIEQSILLLFQEQPRRGDISHKARRFLGWFPMIFIRSISAVSKNILNPSI